MNEGEEINRILNMTEAELRADLAARGLDWDEEVAKGKAVAELAIADSAFEKWRRANDRM